MELCGKSHRRIFIVVANFVMSSIIANVVNDADLWQIRRPFSSVHVINSHTAGDPAPGGA
jgi:hypothetical protein